MNEVLTALKDAVLAKFPNVKEFGFISIHSNCTIYCCYRPEKDISLIDLKNQYVTPALLALEREMDFPNSPYRCEISAIYTEDGLVHNIKLEPIC